jgi:hypothetical protein
MRRTASLALLTLCTLCAALAPACSDDKKAKPATKASTAAAKSKAKPAASTVKPRTAKELLEQVPADAQLAGVVRDLPALYQLFGELLTSFGSLELGAKLLGRVRTLSVASPVPLPWTKADLKKLGVDTAQPLLLVGRGDRLLAHMGLKDPAALRKALGALGPWTEQEHEGIKLSLLSTREAGQIHCRFGAAAAVCGNDRDQVARWGVKAPERSVYAALSKAQRAALEQSTALLWGHDDREGGVVATFRAEPDGLSLRAGIELNALQRLGHLVAALGGADPNKSRILGLAADARGLLYFRAPMHLLLGPLSHGGGAGPLAGLDGKLGGLSGEVLALEDKQGQLALVLGAAGADEAQQAADALALALRAEVAAERKRAGKRGSVKVKPGKLNGRKAYRIAIKADAEQFPLDLEVGLAAGPLGVVLGSWATVARLSKLDAVDAAPAAKALAESVGDKTLARGTSFGLRVGLEDPLRPFGDRLQQMLPPEAPPQLRQGLDLGRFMLEQLHELRVTQALEAPGAIEVRLRLTTKHRRGVAGDDAARSLWIKGLKAKYGGDPAGHEKALAALTASHADSRFGKVRTGGQAGLLSGVVGVGAALAIPAFVKYMRRSKAIEADLNLSRIKAGARRYVAAEHVDRSGKVQPHGFPAGDSGWTPKGKPCCKQPGGRCVSASSDWSASKQWSALGFAVEGRHHFQYRVVGKGAGPRSTITVEARADLDCDGAYSSYVLKGRVKDGAASFDPVRVTKGLE